MIHSEVGLIPECESQSQLSTGCSRTGAGVSLCTALDVREQQTGVGGGKAWLRSTACMSHSPKSIFERLTAEEQPAKRLLLFRNLVYKERKFVMELHMALHLQIFYIFKCLENYRNTNSSSLPVNVLNTFYRSSRGREVAFSKARQSVAVLRRPRAKKYCRIFKNAHCMAHTDLLQQHSPPLLFLRFGDHYKVLIKIPSRIYGKEISGSTIFTSAIIEQIKRESFNLS